MAQRPIPTGKPSARTLHRHQVLWPCGTQPRQKSPAASDVDEEVRKDPGVYPPPEVKAKLFPELSESDEFTRLLNRTWTRFTTGR